MIPEAKWEFWITCCWLEVGKIVLKFTWSWNTTKSFFFRTIRKFWYFVGNNVNKSRLNVQKRPDSGKWWKCDWRKNWMKLQMYNNIVKFFFDIHIHIHIHASRYIRKEKYIRHENKMSAMIRRIVKFVEFIALSQSVFQSIGMGTRNLIPSQSLRYNHQWSFNRQVFIFRFVCVYFWLFPKLNATSWNKKWTKNNVRPKNASVEFGFFGAISKARELWKCETQRRRRRIKESQLFYKNKTLLFFSLSLLCSLSFSILCSGKKRIPWFFDGIPFSMGLEKNAESLEQSGNSKS